jgi:hypothetical protein
MWSQFVTTLGEFSGYDITICDIIGEFSGYDITNCDIIPQKVFILKSSIVIMSILIVKF